MTETTCWCAYGGEGLESVHPQCPIHGTEPAPTPASDRDDDPCDVCRSEWEDCGSCEGGGEDDYASDGRCSDCGGSGGRVPTHCCRCGGGEYDCRCCGTCGGDASVCSCPIPVRLHDGSTRTV